MRTAILFAATLALSAPALAQQNDQLVRQVQMRLDHHGFSDVDAAEFATPTLARLHLTLISPGAFVKKQREIKNILRTAKYREDLDE